MRLDKFLAETTELSRGLAKKAISSGSVTCDGVVTRDPAFKVIPGARVCLDGEHLARVGIRYLMLHKPVDTICSTQDEYYPSVLSLLDIARVDKLHIAGRLDADTTGLVLITDDGQWSHKVTSPKRGCAKRYRVQLADPVSADVIALFARGVQLHGEEGLTKPALLELLGENEALLSITEGKYHQVKRMFAAVGNKVVGLHREAIGNIELDNALAVGEWRYLTEAEVASVK
ncbi:MAG: 16S rRNA pseudouridine(516) synthase RsuA [Plesiomonas shigelloides]